MAKIGIACDRYKVPEYEKELKKHGYDNFEVTQGKQFDVIKIDTDLFNQPAIQKICERMEAMFKTRRN